MKVFSGHLRELGLLFGALGAVPLGPALGLSYAGAAWQALVLSGAWAASWYLWLYARALHAPDEPMG